jgi:predicted GIY-YIG superfamily endonuclease
MKRYYVYMLQCADGSFYVGVTSDLELRIAQHRDGAFPSCYTYMRRPLLLVWSQDFKDADDAIRCEKQIKGWRRAKKAALISGNWELIRTLSRAHASTGSA